MRTICEYFNFHCENISNNSTFFDDHSTPTFISCPPFAFRCSYGGCIPGKRECDGKSDCADDSDEVTLNCPGVKEIYSRTGNCTWVTINDLGQHIRLPIKRFLFSVTRNSSARMVNVFTRIRCATDTVTAPMVQRRPEKSVRVTIVPPTHFVVTTARVSKERVAATASSIASIVPMKPKRSVKEHDRQPRQ